MGSGFPLNTTQLRTVFESDLNAHSPIWSEFGDYLSRVSVVDGWRQMALAINAISEADKLTALAVFVGQPWFEQHANELVPKLLQCDSPAMYFFAAHILLYDLDEKLRRDYGTFVDRTRTEPFDDVVNRVDGSPSTLAIQVAQAIHQRRQDRAAKFQPLEDEPLAFPLEGEQARDLFRGRVIAVRSNVWASFLQYVRSTPLDDVWSQLVLIVDCITEEATYSSLAVVVGEPLFQDHWEELIPRLDQVESSPGFRQFMGGVLLSELPPWAEERVSKFVTPASNV